MSKENEIVVSDDLALVIAIAYFIKYFSSLVFMSYFLMKRDIFLLYLALFYGIRKISLI